MKKDTASRVLIVDDMPVNRMILSSLLASNKVISDSVESGEECLRMCREHDYDLILLDHRMPSPDGVDTFVRLKEIFAEKGRSVPVVCHTTEEGRSNINLYKAAGFSDVLIKPIDPASLLSVLMTYLPEEDLINEKADVILPEIPDSSQELSDDADELDRLPMWIKSVPHIDLVSGIEKCGSAPDYMDTLYIFYSSIEERSAEIEFFLSHEDWTMYTLRVHSLKSIAGLVGIRKLYKKAKELEYASKAGDYEKLLSDTPAMLSFYREFITLLSPVSDMAKQPQKEPDPIKKQPASPAAGNSRTILFVCENGGIAASGIDKNLTRAGFKLITIPDEPELIITNRHEADIILYMPVEDSESHISLTMNLLGEICQDDSKILCLTGDIPDIESAMTSGGAARVSHCYPRPVDIAELISDMEKYSLIEREYHRKKNIYIVDDDPDYMSVIDRWLSDSYNVSCFIGGDDVLRGLMAATPDLILMDYEMPRMDGYELMKNIRKNDTTDKIPIIFLTGKNDRDHVYRILEYRPDGYLLKSSPKDMLLGAIRRFFSETVLKSSLHLSDMEEP